MRFRKTPISIQGELIKYCPYPQTRGSRINIKKRKILLRKYWFIGCFFLCFLYVIWLLNTIKHRVPVHPSRTFLIMLLSVLSPCTMLWLTMHLDEHRYCSRGMRYLPQKSTNLMCSTRSSKNTPGGKKQKKKIRIRKTRGKKSAFKRRDPEIDPRPPAETTR